MITDVFNRLVAAAVALSLALAVAVSFVWYTYCDAPAAQMPPSLNWYGPDWQNVTHQIRFRSGMTEYDLSLTQAGFEFSCFDVANPKSPSFVYAYLEYFYSAVALLLFLPAAWLYWKLRKLYGLEPANTENGDPLTISLRHRGWAIASLVVGVLGLPLYVAIMTGFSPLFFNPNPHDWPGNTVAVVFAFVFNLPLGCLAFVYWTQSLWRRTSIGEIGAFLTITWVTLWMDYFIFRFFLPSLP